jgi:hypothetical protein
MMKPPDKDKCLDQLISRATEGNEHRFTPNFDKWLKDHPEAVQSLNTPDEYALSKILPRRKSTGREPLRIRFPRLTWICGIAALILITASCTVSVFLARNVVSLKHELELARHDAATAGAEESAIINIYAREHQDVVARQASLSPAQPEPMQIQVSQDDILYYEFLDVEPQYMRPGIIVRGTPSEREIDSPETPVISNGHTLSLSEARETANFDLVAPLWLLPCYRLDQIRIIEGRDALQLLYTNGVNSISLFEQSLDGRRGLSHHDFREYAVYNNTEQEGATILAWRDDALSYVLIGNTELSQLMDMAQSISAGK